MKRREFITLLGGAAVAWPLAARAQQPAMIGFLGSASPDPIRDRLRAFRQGLKRPAMSRARTSRSNIAGRKANTIDCRSLAADLVRRQVTVIVAGGGTPSAARGQGGDHDDSNRLRGSGRPGRAWTCRQPEPTRAATSRA